MQTQPFSSNLNFSFGNFRQSWTKIMAKMTVANILDFHNTSFFITKVISLPLPPYSNVEIDAKQDWLASRTNIVLGGGGKPCRFSQNYTKIQQNMFLPKYYVQDCLKKQLKNWQGMLDEICHFWGGIFKCGIILFIYCIYVCAWHQEQSFPKVSNTK